MPLTRPEFVSSTLLLAAKSKRLFCLPCRSRGDFILKTHYDGFVYSSRVIDNLLTPRRLQGIALQVKTLLGRRNRRVAELAIR